MLKHDSLYFLRRLLPIDHAHLLFFLLLVVPIQTLASWTSLAPGMQLGMFKTSKPSPIGDSRITILRIDPKEWDLVFVSNDKNKSPVNLTARQWSKTHNLTAAMNAGMFDVDYSKHIGYFAYDGHVNNRHVNKYRSVAAFGRKNNLTTPEFRIFDLDDPKVSMKSILDNYNSVVQNLRLVKRPGENRWIQQFKMWSEAALGEDDSGNILFIYSRSPFTMYDFNRELLSMGIGLVAAQHLEGGPEAQFFLHIGDTIVEQFGSFETSFQENDSNASPWPIPNIMGVRPKKKPTK